MRGLLGIIGVGLFLSGGVAHADGLCFRSNGGCTPAQELAADGVRHVSFVAQSLQRTDAETSWGLYAYGEGVASATRIDAVIPERVQGEDAVLAAQGRICTELEAAGIDCSRDPLAGTWKSDALRSFQVTFTPQTQTPLLATGTFSTTQWACRRGEGESETLYELACTGRYDTSLRLLYLTNASRVSVGQISCHETGATHPRTAQAFPPCQDNGTYDPVMWLPFSTSGLSYVQSNEARVHSPSGAFSLYRISFAADSVR